MDFISGLLPTVLEYTIRPVIRHAGYAFRCAKKVAELKNQVEKLGARRESLQNSVAEAIRRGDEIQPDVKKWLTDAENAIKGAGELTERGEEEAKCFAGLCPNFKTRYQLGKRAAVAIEAMKKEGNFDPSQISYRAAPQQIVNSSAHGFEGLPSRASIFKEVMVALSDPNVNMIGVYGMAGTGKSTLAKEVQKQALVRNLFDVVPMAIVSVKPDLKEIQGNIADMLGLELKEQTLDGRANRICQRLLKEEKVLIILDDLWEKIELEKLGIPLTNDKRVNKGDSSIPEIADSSIPEVADSSIPEVEQRKNYHMGCKLLLTSRNRDLFCDMGVKKEFMLDVLPEKESRTLFEKTVGDLENPRLQSIAIEVADKCAGLPLSLVTVASALKNKEFGIWEDALNRLSASKGEEKASSALELSYDHLPGEEVKAFFLLCGLFADPNIYILDLVKYSMGLGLLEDVERVEAARNRVQKLIGDLKARCLLLESQMDGYIKIHDVVQKVAASIASRDQLAFIKDGVTSEEFQRNDLKRCTRIVLDDSDVFEFPEMVFRCPEIVLFSLSPKDRSMKIPDSSFEGITKLQVLHFTKMRFSSLPASLGSLTSLCTLCLDFCTLEDISVTVQLKNLEILSLMGSEIVGLPGDLAQLTRLKLLDLSNCSKLEFIPENVLSRLSLLEELLMGNSFVSWEVKPPDNQRNASLSELEHLSRLTNLEIHVPDAKKLPRRLFSERLKRYKVFIGDEWDWRGKYQTSRTLKLKLDTSTHRKHGVNNLLKDVEDLYLDEVKGITNVLYDLYIEGFQQLKHLNVQNSRDIRHIMDSPRRVYRGAFPVLESLILHNLVNLEKISRGNLMAEDFCKLRIVRVGSCNRLKNLFSFSMVTRNLQQLLEIEIMDCSNMEVIFADESEEEEGDDKNEVVELTQLYSLKLRLPQLQSFCSKVRVSPASTSTSHSRKNQSASDPPFMEIVSASDTSFPIFNEKIVFPNLNEMNLSSINVVKIWHDQFADQRSFHKLTSLTVETCKNLNYLFTPLIVKSLAQLQKLEICDCKSMGDVIAAEGEIVDKTPFSKLEFLKLKGLPKLSTFCIGALMEFPNLKELWIEDCHQLKAFISNPVAVNTESNLALFDEKVAFPKLERLSIVNMDRFKMIWHNELHGSSFHKLKSIIIEHAKELVNIFSFNMLRSRFLNLENLKLNDCPLVEEVFNNQPQALINSSKQGSIVSRLRKLTIENLPNLKHIWNKHPQETEIISFNDLQVVDVYKCRKLKGVFPAFVAKGLVQLEKLVLMICPMEEIVEKDEGTEAIVRFEFPKLTTLTLHHLWHLKTLYPGMHTSEWPMLKILDVNNCRNMEVFASESESVQEDCWGNQLDNHLKQPFFSAEEVIPNLEKLSLTGKEAQMIRVAQFPARFFDGVRFLRLAHFDKKSASFLFDLLQRFHNLEELEIINNELEEMFSCEGSVSGENQGSIVARIPHMRLYSLMNLRNIWRRDCQVEHMLEVLKTLEVWICHGLLSLAPSIASFGSLSYLYVWACKGLLNLVTSSTAKYLRHLTHLSIRDCDMVEEIIAGEEDDREDQITWDNLESLELRGLASLTRFSSAYHTFEFPSLEKVMVTGCPKMRTFSEGVSITPKLKRVKIAGEDAKGRWEGDLNTTIQRLCAELVGLRGLEHLKLSDFPELKETWHKEHFPANSLSDLRSLVVDECVYYSNAVPSNLLRSLDNLAELEVKNCDSVEEVFDLILPNACDGEIGTLCKLNKLQLIDLPRLKQLWREEPKGVFPLRNLQVLKIHNCSTLRSLFTPTTCLGLVQLRELEVKSCTLIEEIITKGAASESTVDKVMLPLLTSVSLGCLPNLTSFYSGGGSLQCPSLKRIVIIECSSTFTFTFLNEHPPFNACGATQTKIVFPILNELELSSIGLDKIWHGEFADRRFFCKLTSLTVEACRNLNYLFTPSIVKSLEQLQKVEICDCKLIENVITTEGEIIGKTAFPNLEFLKLKGLPKLSTFCIGALMEFSNLKELWIEDCHELKTFISNPVAVNTGSNLALFDEKVAFPKLEGLWIVKMDRLKMIWHNELHESSFYKLKSIIVEHAKELVNIFSFNVLRSRLLNLENLKLNDCPLVEEVFNNQPQALINSNKQGRTVSRLKKLTIENLPNLKHIWNKHPQETEIISFNELQVVDVYECRNLKGVFPAFIAKGLVQLEKLVLMICPMEEIVEKDEGTEAIVRFEFPKLTTLTLHHLWYLKTLYPGMHTSKWPMLKILDVNNCRNMEVFTSKSESVQEDYRGSQLDNHLKQPFFSADKVIPNLEKLSLTGKEAQMIRVAQFPARFFDGVRFLRLAHFDKKSASFLFDLLQRFHNLEELEIINNELEEMFSCEGSVSGDNHGSIVARIPHMRLYSLMNLRNIWRRDCQVEHMLEDLETLEVWICHGLLSLAPSISSFGNLSHLDVQKCQGLLNLVTSSTAQYLGHLTKLSISQCDVVEEIVAREEDEREEQITWGNLKKLTLHCLASLTCFSSAHHTFKFPSLEEVMVTGCPKMKTFSEGISITPKLKRVKLAGEDAKWRWEGDLNTTIQRLCAELV